MWMVHQWAIDNCWKLKEDEGREGEEEEDGDKTMCYRKKKKSSNLCELCVSVILWHVLTGNKEVESNISCNRPKNDVWVYVARRMCDHIYDSVSLSVYVSVVEHVCQCVWVCVCVSDGERMYNESRRIRRRMRLRRTAARTVRFIWWDGEADTHSPNERTKPQDTERQRKRKRKRIEHISVQQIVNNNNGKIGGEEEDIYRWKHIYRRKERAKKTGKKLAIWHRGILCCV